MRKSRLLIAWLAFASAGCATTSLEPARVVSMTAAEGASREGFPPAGAVWRLDERELEALGPVVQAPDPPPAPRRSSRPEPVLVPSFIYFGSHHGFGWHDPFFWPRYHRFPYYGPHGYHWLDR